MSREPVRRCPWCHLPMWTHYLACNSCKRLVEGYLAAQNAPARCQITTPHSHSSMDDPIDCPLTQNAPTPESAS